MENIRVIKAILRTFELVSGLNKFCKKQIRINWYVGVVEAKCSQLLEL